MNYYAVNLWTWQCAMCGWKVRSELTVNDQQAVAEVLIRLHIRQHDEAQDAQSERPKAHRND